MNRIQRSALFLVSGLIAASPTFADKPSWAGGEKHEKHEKKHDGRKEDRRDDRHDRYEDRNDDRNEDRRSRIELRFGDDNRRIVNEYYGPMFTSGNCPPGLAKKHNGCQPPGQAKKWARGRPLPSGVEYYELPHELLLRLPPPPEHHRYVRVASDILLIAVGTSMVVDALEDIGR